MDYPVPNFGRDHAINDSEDSLKTAEKMLKHKWEWKKAEAGDDIPTYHYKPMDPDIVVSLDNLKN